MSDYLKFHRARLQKELRKKSYIADLEYWEIKSRNIDEVIAELLKLDMAGNEEIHNFPIWAIMESEENQKYLHAVVPEIIKKIKGPKISLRLDYGGKPLYKFFFLADMLSESSIPELLNNISNEISFLTDECFWKVAGDDQEEGHPMAKEMLLDFTNDLEKHKVLQKLKFAGSVIGRKIIDRALVMCDCLTIKEMESVLKGQPQFVTSYYEDNELQNL